MLIKLISPNDSLFPPRVVGVGANENFEDLKNSLLRKVGIPEHSCYDLCLLPKEVKVKSRNPINVMSKWKTPAEAGLRSGMTLLIRRKEYRFDLDGTPLFTDEPIKVSRPSPPKAPVPPLNLTALPGRASEATVQPPPLPLPPEVPRPGTPTCTKPQNASTEQVRGISPPPKIPHEPSGDTNKAPPGSPPEGKWTPEGRWVPAGAKASSATATAPPPGAFLGEVAGAGEGAGALAFLFARIRVDQAKEAVRFHDRGVAQLSGVRDAAALREAVEALVAEEEKEREKGISRPFVSGLLAVLSAVEECERSRTAAEEAAEVEEAVRACKALCTVPRDVTPLEYLKSVARSSSAKGKGALHFLLSRAADPLVEHDRHVEEVVEKTFAPLRATIDSFLAEEQQARGEVDSATKRGIIAVLEGQEVALRDLLWRAADSDLADMMGVFQQRTKQLCCEVADRPWEQPLAWLQAVDLEGKGGGALTFLRTPRTISRRALEGLRAADEAVGGVMEVEEEQRALEHSLAEKLETDRPTSPRGVARLAAEVEVEVVEAAARCEARWLKYLAEGGDGALHFLATRGVREGEDRELANLLKEKLAEVHRE
eukprot:Sspe_Gene.101900::Locus_76589_Transcript_1_1_Confidence_1.000_Length_2012::g.101900::m.101900